MNMPSSFFMQKTPGYILVFVLVSITALSIAAAAWLRMKGSFQNQQKRLSLFEEMKFYAEENELFTAAKFKTGNIDLSGSMTATVSHNINGLNVTTRFIIPEFSGESIGAAAAGILEKELDTMLSQPLLEKIKRKKIHRIFVTVITPEITEDTGKNSPRASYRYRRLCLIDKKHQMWRIDLD